MSEEAPIFLGGKSYKPMTILRLMLSAGLIQFDEGQPDCTFSVWGFGQWEHDQDLYEAIRKVALGSPGRTSDE